MTRPSWLHPLNRVASFVAFVSCFLCVASGLLTPFPADATVTLIDGGVTPNDPGKARPLSATPQTVATPATDATSDAIGATVAKFNVDNAGNAAYSIPVQLPPPTAGLGPKLALTYNSRLGYGVMGQGWAIDGTSQVTRCRQTRESGDFVGGTVPDGNAQPVNFTATDRFCLDGIRLLKLTGTNYGDDGSTYSPENDPSTKVTAHVTAATAAAGPDSFTVQRKDGTKSTYGYDATVASNNARISATLPATASTVYVSWNLARTQDSLTNYVDYLYTTTPSGSTFTFGSTAVEFVLSQVKYTGNITASMTPYATVTFGYCTYSTTSCGGIPDIRIGFQSGIAFIASQRLQTVTVTDGSHTSTPTLRYYELTYDTSIVASGGSGSGVQRLKQLLECRDSFKTVCFQPTTFTWSAANTNQIAEATQTVSGGPSLSNFAGYKIADVDGDGRTDVALAVNDGACTGGSSIYIGFLDQTTSHQMTLNMSTSGSQTPFCSPINLAGQDRAWYLLDYDGDGMADLMIGGATGSTWKLYLSKGRPVSGAVFDTCDRLNGMCAGADKLTTPISVITADAIGLLADLNGSGLPAFLYPADIGPFGVGVGHNAYSGLQMRQMVRQTDGKFIFSDPYPVYLTFLASDTNCNGTTSQCSIGFLNSDVRHGSLITTDVDGDGRSDLTFVLTVTPCSPVCQNIVANGTTVTPLVVFDPALGETTSATSSSSTFYWYQFAANGINQPTGFTQPAQFLRQYFSNAVTGVGLNLPSTSDRMFVADVTGDGLADLVYQDSVTTTTWCAMVNNGGTTSNYSPPVCRTGLTSDNTQMQLADLFGDGRLSLVYPSGAGATFNYTTLSRDNTAFSAPAAIPGGGATAGSTLGQWINTFSDFDGDGATDYARVQVGTSGTHVYSSRIAGNTSTTTCTATTNSGTCSRYHARDVIVSFKNGLGATTNVSYEPLTNKGVYKRGGEAGYPALSNTNYGFGSPVLDVLAPIYVASQASSSAPIKGAPTATSTLYYRYSGALMQSGGRGFLGFFETWSFDNNDAAATSQFVVSTNRYAQSYPVVGVPEASMDQVFPSSASLRGSAELDACSANPEDANYTCFAPSNTNPWPQLLDAGIRIHFGSQQPACNGIGCAALGTSGTTCNAFNSAQTPTIPTETTTGVWSPQSTVGPIFSYTSHTDDLQYDIGTGSAGHPAPTAETQNYFCYDGNSTTPGVGNLLNSHTLTLDGLAAIVAEKLVANQYGSDDATKWFLGRLTNSTVSFRRPGLVDPPARTSDFTYSTTTGLLTSERVMKGGSADLDLRTVYTYDGFGNRTGAYQCSNDFATDSACTSTTGFAQQQSGTTVHRYAKTDYDAVGRYSIDSKLPFYSSGGTGHLNEHIAITTTTRDEYGNATSQTSANGLAQTAEYGVLGRPYFSSDNTGKSSTTTYRLCNSGTTHLCSGDSMFVFRSQTVTAGVPTTWTYFDVLGRPLLKIAQAFDTNPTGQKFTAACSYVDSHNRSTYTSEPFFLNVAANSSDGGAPTLPGGAASPCASAVYATTTQYDILGRVKLITNPDGGTINKCDATGTMCYPGLTTFTTNPRGFAWEETKNALGEVIETRDPSVTGDTTVGVIVDYVYDGAGDVTTIRRDARNNGGGATSVSKIETTFTYDALGRKKTQTDPDSGLTQFSYNAAGDVIQQTDAKSQTVTQSFDALGRRWQRIATGTTTATDTWTFDTATNGYGQLATESRSSTAAGAVSFTRSLLYDGNGRLDERDTNIGANAYTEVTAYDSIGRANAQQDASGYTLTTNFTTDGYLSYLSDSRVGTIYQVLGMTARNQVSSEKRGDSTAMVSTLSYYPNSGRVHTVCSGTSCGLQDLSYVFDLAGNLTQRERATSTAPTIEVFTNDAINRLTLSQLTKVQGVNQSITTASLAYDLIGNVCTKNGTAYTYAGYAGCTNHGTSGSPHAATKFGTVTYQYDADGSQTTSNSGRTLAYNPLNQLVSASAGTNTTTFQYSPDGDRFLRTDGGQRVWPSSCASDNVIGDRIFCDGFDGGGSSGGTQNTYYVGNVEVLVNGAASEYRRYLGGVAIDNSVSGSTLYLFADHLGSIDVVASTIGSLIESMSFDVHGNRRDPTTWQGGAVPPSSTTHGFTGHEHVDNFQFIHMNGRIYDPSIGRMLQADPLAGPGNQSLNRYSYVVNNPLALTDPTGYSWWGDALRIAAVVVISYYTAGWGATLWAEESYASALAVVGAGGFAAGAVQTGNLKGALTGAFSAELFFGVGEYFNSAGWAHEGGNIGSTNLNSVGYTAKVLSHGVVGGIMAKLEGGKFGNGFWSAGVSEAASPGIDKLDPENPIGQSVSANRIIAASIVGGTTSVIAGGKFGNGAITSAFGRAFNEEMSVAQQPKKTTVAFWYESAFEGYAHAAIVVTDSDGSQWFMRGGPSDRDHGDVSKAESEANSPTSSGSSGGSWGYIKVDYGNFVPGAIDYTTKPLAIQTLLTTTTDASTIEGELQQFGNAVNAARVNYNPLIRNSNTFAFDAVTVLDIPKPTPLPSVNALGWDQPLGVPHGH